MLKYIIQQRQETLTRLQALEREALTLRGALAALDDILEHARTQQTGGGSVAAPPVPTEPAPAKADTGGMTALRIGHAPVQADDELRG